ncbi:anti-sigma factor domain-containing protein [Proteiniborus sp.]|uniref:anti-sigma factor domain-containing protein n=1 Tax=Proteiniborus sp. TaxID=2079015 RepID=UPI003321BC6E
MRGIVMEKNNEGLIVMTDDGQYLEINNYTRTVEIGQEIEVKNTVVHKTEVFRRIASIAAAIILFLSGSYGIYGHYMVFGYVDVDINPSVELSYNLYNRVIGIKGINEDGENLLENVKDYKNKPIQVVVNKVIDSAIKEKYIKANEENTVLITITENKSEIDKTILEEIDSHIKNSSLSAEVVVMESDKKSFEDAKKVKLSPGKLKLIEKAAGGNNKINPAEIKEKSVKEIVNIIKENNQEDKNLEKIIKSIEKENKELDKLNKKIEKEKEKEDRKAEKENRKTTKSDKKKDESNSNNNSKKDNEKNNKNIKSTKTNRNNGDKDKDNNKSNNKSKDKNQKKNNKDNEKESKKNEKNNSKNNQKNNK